MDWHLLAPFLAATLLLLLVPGPVMAVVTHNTLRGGATTGLSTVAGVEIGRFLQLGVTLAGVMVSAEYSLSLFRFLSLAGTFYLVWLALKAIWLKRRPAPSQTQTRFTSPVTDGLAVAFSNPATLVFYTAFFPQFIRPDSSVAQQAVTLGILFLSTSFICETTLVFACSRIRQSWSGGEFARFAGAASIALHVSVAAVAVFSFARTLS
ncbi:LysE family translocator [Taklimakanibacter lacteus]|uniref:LysE family translocator n=1 Tax=Taklimakanibacter lacteus TaxID=2268456 RepID=UPI000E663C1F